MKRHRLAGSAIGGSRETQEMLDFCGQKGITADIERIKVQQVNEAYDRFQKGGVKYRFVIDMASLRSEGELATKGTKEIFMCLLWNGQLLR